MTNYAQDPYEQQEAGSDAFNSKCRTIAEHLINFELDEVQELTGHDFAEWMLERESDNERTLDLMHNQLLSMIKRSSDWHTHVLELATDFLQFVEG